MLTGKRFRLRRKTLGIERNNGKSIAVSVPAGAIIVLADCPRPNDMRLVDVIWDDRTLVLFAEDVLVRGEEVRAVSECIGS
jgi:hypothetical protein